MHVCKVAAEWRAEFGKDVVIDLVWSVFVLVLNELAEVGRQLSVLSFRQFLAGSWQKHYANYALFDLPSRNTLWLFVVLARTRLPNLLLVITRLLVYSFNIEQCL